MERYLVVIEKAKCNYSAFSPYVLGCATTGNTVESTLLQMKEALAFHLETMFNDCEDVPNAKSISQHISDGIFNDGEIADEYLITQVETTVQRRA